MGSRFGIGGQPGSHRLCGLFRILDGMRQFVASPAMRLQVLMMMLFLRLMIADSTSAAVPMEVVFQEARQDFKEGRVAAAKAKLQGLVNANPQHAEALALLKLIAAQEANPSRLTETNYVVSEINYEGTVNDALDDLSKKAEALSGGRLPLNLVRQFPPAWGKQKTLNLNVRNVPLAVALRMVAEQAGLTITQAPNATILRIKPQVAGSPSSKKSSLNPGKVEPSEAPAPDSAALPLPDFLTNAIVASDRVSLSEAHSLNPSLDRPPSLTDAVPGRMLAYIRPGFVLQLSRYQDNGGLTAVLPVPLGAQSLAYAPAAGFQSFGKIEGPATSATRTTTLPVLPLPFTPQTMRVYVPTKDTELLDVVSRQGVVLRNGAGSIREAWTFQPRPADAPAFGLVKTTAGYFVGILREKNTEPPRFTWEQLRRENTWRFRLKEVNTVVLQKGTRLFQMADLKKSTRPLRFIDAPQEARLTPALYEILMRSGLSGVCAELDTPMDDGVEEAPIGTAPAVGGARGLETVKESLLDSVNARFLQWQPASTELTIEYVRDERLIMSMPGGVMETKPWKTSRLQKTVSIENDPDGGARFTDGRAVYEIMREGVSIRLRTFAVEESPQFKPNR